MHAVKAPRGHWENWARRAAHANLPAPRSTLPMLRIEQSRRPKSAQPRSNPRSNRGVRVAAHSAPLRPLHVVSARLASMSHEARRPSDRSSRLNRLRLQVRLIPVRASDGVGSVATRCWVILLLGRDSSDPLFLHAKEAPRSMRERFPGRSEFSNQGQRVVEGQRLMQAASDTILGWLHNPSPSRTPSRTTTTFVSYGTRRARPTSL